MRKDLPRQRDLLARLGIPAPVDEYQGILRRFRPFRRSPGDRDHIGIEGRARFFLSQSISLPSPVFGFTETGSTGATTDHSALGHVERANEVWGRPRLRQVWQALKFTSRSDHSGLRRSRANPTSGQAPDRGLTGFVISISER
jgi:hypothetical protein